jgi:hypothetical protein
MGLNLSKELSAKELDLDPSDSQQMTTACGRVWYSGGPRSTYHSASLGAFS